MGKNTLFEKGERNYTDGEFAKIVAATWGVNGSSGLPRGVAACFYEDTICDAKRNVYYGYRLAIDSDFSREEIEALLTFKPRRDS